MKAVMVWRPRESMCVDVLHVASPINPINQRLAAVLDLQEAETRHRMDPEIAGAATAAEPQNSLHINMMPQDVN